jgi:hypothetical protein
MLDCTVESHIRDRNNGRGLLGRHLIHLKDCEAETTARLIDDRASLTLIELVARPLDEVAPIISASPLVKPLNHNAHLAQGLGVVALGGLAV